MSILAERAFVADSVVASAPALPVGRPPTKREVWEHLHHIYSDRKTTAELKTFCREAWAWQYLEWVNFRGWDKHPDWTAGPAIAEAVPKCPFKAGTNWSTEVERLWKLAQEPLRRAA